MDYRIMYEKWLSFDETAEEELSLLSEAEIEDRFYRELEFGTGGLRGIIGAGTNRMNIYTVRKATQGLANYMLNQDIPNLSVAIAYDSRRYSDLFAKEAALVLNANGIVTYIYDELKPTPMLSFAVRSLKATAGIVITASHNPKEYNGYKAYWNDGGQITEEHAEGILREINNLDYSDIKTMDYEEALFGNLYKFVPAEVEKDYIDLVKDLAINTEIINEMGSKLRIVYTPLHGTGNIPVRTVLKELGFSKVYVVAEQEAPDYNFSTVKYPNPEEAEVFEIGKKLAKEKEADLIIGTDPDCDRVGIVVKDSHGEYIVLSGNQVGVLLTEYMLSQLKKSYKLPESSAVIKTVVTTELAGKICEAYGVRIIDVLTGFKYIGEKIKEFENSNINFILGFEESYGYLAGTFVRDKDAVIATSLICEMAAFYKSKNMSLYDGLMELYKKYGFYKEGLSSITLKGIEGIKQMNKIMESLRSNTPDELAGLRVVRVKDYLNKTDNNKEKGRIDPIMLPKSNVLQLFLEEGSIVTIRPSGTEPKIKFYFAAVGKNSKDADSRLEKLKEEVMNIAK